MKIDVRAAAFLKWSLWLNGALLGLTLILAFAISASWDSLMGVVVGGAIGTANLTGLCLLARRLIYEGRPRWPFGVALGLKFLLLVALVYLAVQFVSRDIVWFVVGVSVPGLAILAAALHLSVRGIGSDREVNETR